MRKAENVRYELYQRLGEAAHLIAELALRTDDAASVVDLMASQAQSDLQFNAMRLVRSITLERS